MVTVEPGGQALELPVFLINGAGDGPTLCITGGVHAAEYASIAAALEVGQGLQPAQLRGRVIVIPVVNLPGFPVRAIYVCPLDGKNPNRFFPGDPGGSPTEQLTAWIFENAIRQANYYIDLHGGDLIEALTPFTLFYRSGNEEVDRVSQELAQVFGIPYIVRSETAGSAYSAASRAGIPAILAEAGGQGIWHAEDVAAHRNGVENVLHHLGMLEGPARPVPSCRLIDRFLWLRSGHDGFWYPATGVGDTVSEGQELGQVRDFQGRVLQTANAPAAGKVLFLVSSLAVNDNDPLLAVGA
jgi:predicted deacylase